MSSRMKIIRRRAAVGLTTLVAAGLLASCSSGGSSSSGASATGSNGIHKIQHVVVIMQENRSFDTYFGAYPGAEGIPMANGSPTVCVPDPSTNQCVKPYVDHADVNGGGPHSQNNATADINGGKMNGFIGQAQSGRRGCSDPTNPACTNSTAPDVMGYHTQSDIPNYWSYANDFVLQDHMFEPNASWSLPQHLYMVSEWSALCANPLNAFSCTNALQSPNSDSASGGANDGALHYAWTDLTYLLHKQGISWGYYIFQG
ncbi:MAG TPA: alkaline phosphatase family protein, partial [Acidimicrobiales bacterium]|nr:alkaline phosphatase family protein [Acidimicrobiales bacterium]